MKSILRKKPLVLSNGKVVQPKPSYLPIIIILLFVAIWVAGQVTNFSFPALMRRGHQFFVILNDMVPPNRAFLTRVWSPLFDTIKMSLLGSLTGSIIALPLAFLASQNIVKNRFVAGFFKFFLSFLRTVPTLIVALIATLVFGLGTLAGTLAILIFTISYVGKLTYEQIESVDMGTFEALESMGFTRFQAFRYAIISEILPTYLSTAIFNFEGNLRFASILGYVGAGGLGILLNEQLGWRNYANVGAILFALILTVAIIESASEYLRKKLQ